jgi:hypothetical protein
VQYLPHPLGLFALVFGILLTMRKLDVGHRLPEQFPNVRRADFEGWKAQAMAAYGFGVWACFLKLMVDFAGKYLFARLQPSRQVGFTVGITLDLIWIAAMIVTYRRIRAAHAVAGRLGIETPARAEPDSP